MSNSNSLTDWLGLIQEKDKSAAGSLYLCKSGGVPVIGLDVLSKPAIDHEEMSVRMRISTDHVDRQRHCIRQNGIKTDLYRENPVVLFEHGKQGIPFPVAISDRTDPVDPTKKELCVWTLEDGTYAKAFHNPNQKLSAQFFSLVCDEFIRASSIGITPINASLMFDADGGKVPVVDTGYMNEWSYAVIGINPFTLVKSTAGTSAESAWLEEFSLQTDAAIRILERGTLDGSAIDPLFKSFLSIAVPKSKASTSGTNFGEKDMSLQTADTANEGGTDQTTKKKLDPKLFQLLKSMGSMCEYDEKSQGLMKAFAGGETVDWESADVVEDTAEAETESAEERPQGAVVVAGLYLGLAELIATTKEAITRYELPKLVENIDVLIGDLETTLTAIEGAYATAYPDQPPLAGGEPDVTEDMLKSMLSAVPRHLMVVDALSARVKTVLSQATDLKPALKKSLANTVTDLGRLSSAAREFKLPENIPPAFMEKLGTLEKSFTTLREQLDKKPVD